MNFAHHYYQSLEEAQEITRNNPYCVFTMVKGKNVLSTEVEFARTAEDEGILEELQENERTQMQFFHLLKQIQADYVNLFLDEIYMDQSDLSIKPEDAEFIKQMYEAFRPRKKVPNEAPVISKDWEYAKWQVGECTQYIMEDLVDKEVLALMDEKERIEHCIELYNEGVIRGWNAHRDMIRFREKYKQDLKYGARVSVDERKAYISTRRGISDLVW